MKQEPPFAIQLEPTEGCSLACSFCGIQSIRDNGADADAGTHGKSSAPYRFMAPSTVEDIAVKARDLGWNPRWEFAMHGEPTLNKHLPLMIGLVRENHPHGYIMVTTNGSGLLGSGCSKKALFNAGLNTLAVDLYKHAPFRGRLLDLIDAWSAGHDITGDIPVLHYPGDKDGNPHKRHNGKKIVVINDISDNTSGTHQLTNQGGNSFSAQRLDQRCAKPFRELSVRWDGNVALCCDDWRGVYKIGNVHDMPLEDLWNHPRFEAARRMLYAADRGFGPCAGCNVRTHRNGLLPDKYGKQDMPAPNHATTQQIRMALSGKVFTIKIKKGD